MVGMKRKRAPTYVARKKRRALVRRRAYRRLGGQSLTNRSFRIVRWSSADAPNNCHFTVTGNDLAPSQDNATTFRLANVNGSGELVSLFDNFRILGVQYRWVLVRNPSEYSGTTAVNKGVYPRIIWSHDFNDSAPITRALLYQRANLREEFMGDSNQVTKWYTLKPAILAQMYESGVATAYQPSWRKWLDTADNDSPHYGIKWSVDNLYTGVSVRMEAKILMEFKGIS